MGEVEPAAVGELFGGKKVLKRELKSPEDLIDIVRRGLPYQAVERLTVRLATPLTEVSKNLGLVYRTLNRRKERAEPLSEPESERVMRLARTFARATAVLGDEAAALQWIRSPNRALGGKTPMSMLDVDVGAQIVDQVLGRIEYGVYS